MFFSGKATRGLRGYQCPWLHREDKLDLLCGLGFASGLGLDTPGAFEEKKCVAGFYTDAPGQSACLPATPGSIVPTDGASTQEPCDVGTYSGSGESECNELHGQSCEEDAKQHRFTRGGHHHRLGEGQRRS